MSRFKILAIFLCLIITVWGIPQANTSSAAEVSLCSSVEIPVTIKYTIENSTQKYSPAIVENKLQVPKEANAIYFTLEGKLTKGRQYIANINREVELAQHNEAYSTQATFYNEGDKIELSVDKNKKDEAGNNMANLFKPTQGSAIYYKVLLLESINNKFDKDKPFCHIADYQIGPRANFAPCNIQLNDSEPGRGQLVTATVSNVPLGSGDYQIMYSRSDGIDSVDRNNSSNTVTIDREGKGSFTFKAGQTTLTDATVTVIASVGQGANYSCSAKFSITNKTVSDKPTCVLLQKQTHFTVLDKPKVVATNLTAGVEYKAKIININKIELEELGGIQAAAPERSATFTLSSSGSLPEGRYEVIVYRDPNTFQCSSGEFTVGTPESKEVPDPAVTDICKKDPTKCTSGGGREIEGCSKDSPDNPGIVTAIGCIRTNPPELVKSFMTFTVGIGGGLAFLMMLLGAFQMLTSAGNPETLNAGKDRLTNAVIGLLFIIFAVLLLQIIGVDILKIPGFDR